MIRLLLLLLGTLSTARSGTREAPSHPPHQAGDPGGETVPLGPYPDPGMPQPGPHTRPERPAGAPASHGGGSGSGHGGGQGTGHGTGPVQPAPLPPGQGPVAGGPARGRFYVDGRYVDGRYVDGRRYGARRRRVPLWVKWAAAVALIGLVFRRAIASVVLLVLSAALHLVGLNVHLPSIKFAWPWQTITAGTTTNTDLGPWVLQKIEGISKPALGQANFNFVFTHKVSKNIGPWPCWYASTFYAVGHASATVNLNPGPTWWAPGTGHYRLRVVSRPHGQVPGHVSVTMVLPQPQLPQTVHDVTIDDLPSKPIDTQHSWTYPGFGCGVLIKPQFQQSVLYAQAQQIAFYKARHAAGVTGPLIRTAEAQAAQTIRNNFIQPTVNAFGYQLDQLTVHWAAPGAVAPVGG